MITVGIDARVEENMGMSIVWRYLINAVIDTHCSSRYAYRFLSSFSSRFCISIVFSYNSSSGYCMSIVLFSLAIPVLVYVCLLFSLAIPVPVSVCLLFYVAIPVPVSVFLLFSLAVPVLVRKPDLSEHCFAVQSSTKHSYQGMDTPQSNRCVSIIIIIIIIIIRVLTERLKNHERYS